MKGSFEGTPAGFYSWVHKIAFNKGNKVFNQLAEERATDVPLFVTRDGDDDGDQYEEENPALHEEEHSNSSVRIPRSVQGVDLTICRLMLTTVRGADGKYRGRNYANIGLVLGMTENAVKQRIKGLRSRYEEGTGAGEGQEQ